MKYIALCSVALWLVSNVVGAEPPEYLGAAAALAKADVLPAAVKEKSPAARDAEKLIADLEAFQGRAGAMPANEAAAGWLALADRYIAVAAALAEGRDDSFSNEGLRFDAVLKAMPPPVAWKELSAATEARPLGEGKAAARTIALRMLAHTLTGNAAARQGDLDAFEALLKGKQADELANIGWSMRSLLDALAGAEVDPDRILKEFERRLTEMEASAASLDSSYSRYARYLNTLDLPDLVTLAGEKRAEQLLRRALVVPVSIRVEVGDQTRALAQRLALELIDQLKVPQWRLIQTLDAVSLYEALQKKFVATATDGDESPTGQLAGSLQRLSRASQDRLLAGDDKQQADIYYWLGLIAGGRTKDAIAFAQRWISTKEDDRQISVPQQALDALDRAGHSRALHDFLHDLLAANPGIPLWREYTHLAARFGLTGELVKLARTSADRPQLTPRQRFSVRRQLVDAVLAADQVDEGVTELRKLLDEQIATRDGDDHPDQAVKATKQIEENKGSLALQLVRLGRLLEHDNWVAEGLRATQTATATLSSLPGESSPDNLTHQLAEQLTDSGRGAEAETLLVKELARGVAEEKAQQNQPGYSAESFIPTAQSSLVELAGLYHRVGRHKDVLALLDTAPWWGTKDIKELLTRTDSTEIPLSLIAATALAKNDRPAAARDILDAYLDMAGGHDPVYELRITLGGDRLARLDELFRRDQFEERPLIWKAHLLLHDGKLDDAERTVKQAIAIDPSDGEQGPPDRMRAYAVLADIMDARGDKKQAGFYREVVKAIRLSEQADKYARAGLLKRAVALYDEALTHFADAYCVQSRIALQLAELGQLDQAAVHYRRAYELMPDSFGRMESHCFGCEGVFSGQFAQNLAEKVFVELLTKTPDKPQAHYLLGYLRKQQNRFPEALASFRRATELDPDYLNAWQHLQSLGRQVFLSRADQDAVALNLLRLDPQQRHVTSDLNQVADLRALWQAVAAAGKLQRPERATVYPLAASKTAVEKREQSAARHDRWASRQSLFAWGYEKQGLPSPGQVLAQHSLLRGVAEVMDATVSR